ncbi:hypothetical protein WMO79_00685 [Micrococcaceae bacterium Sec7.4]
MPDTQKPRTNIEALEQVENAVTRVMTLISAVLRKYPQNTVPEKLLPFRHTHADRAVRRSTKGDDLVLASTSFFYKTATLRIPLALLDAPEQAITRWARDQYWSGIEGSKFQARKEARANADKASRALDQAQLKLDRALQELATVSAPGKKKRQG